MSKYLEFTYDGKEYKLEFTRKTVTEMEKKGFVVTDLEKKPNLYLPALFEGAFLAHHRYVKKEVIESILDKITDRIELVGKLAEMYNEPLENLLSEPEESEGNVKWTANW